MFDLLKPYILYLKVAILITAITAIFFGWKSFLDSQRKIGYDNAVAEFRIREDAARREVQEKERQWNLQWQQSVKERLRDEEEITQLRVAASGAERRLLLATKVFNERVRDLTTEACSNAVTTSTALLSECAGRYRQLAEAADGHIADLKQCYKAWPGED